MNNQTEARAIATWQELAALPIGSVCVDPMDAKGDAPVVLCRAVRGWQILGEHHERVWHDQEVMREASERFICVYVPGLGGNL